jgi:cyanate permease
MANKTTTYSQQERFWLWCLSVFGFAAVNGAFMYGMLFQPAAMADALTNPIALAFIVEALVLMGVLGYLMSKWRVARLHWGWFVVLSLSGSMAFALPIVLLWSRRVQAAAQARA